MPIAPTTIVRHELIGLAVRVVEATNPDLVGIEGRVVGETMQTLRISEDSEKMVPKTGTRFEFRLPDGEYVVVDGYRLVARPADRTQTAGGTRWHSD